MRATGDVVGGMEKERRGREDEEMRGREYDRKEDREVFGVHVSPPRVDAVCMQTRGEMRASSEEKA